MLLINPKVHRLILVIVLCMALGAYLRLLPFNAYPSSHARSVLVLLLSQSLLGKSTDSTTLSTPTLLTNTLFGPSYLVRRQYGIQMKQQKASAIFFDHSAHQNWAGRSDIFSAF